MDLVTIFDSESNNYNRRLKEVLQSALDLNIEVEAILSSTDSDRSGFDPEVECVGEIKVVSKDSSIPRHIDWSRDLSTNIEGVSVAQLPRKTRKRQAGWCLGSSRLDLENNPDSILS